MANLKAAERTYLQEFLIPTVKANIPASKERDSVLKWIEGCVKSEARPTLNVRFISEADLKDTRDHLRELAEYLGHSEADTLYWVMREAPHLIRDIEALNQAITTPTLTFDLRRQLPLWRNIIKIIDCMRNGRL